jgi:hypothetical protein
VHKQIPPTAALLVAVLAVLAGGRMVERPAVFELPPPEDFLVSDDTVASTTPGAGASAKPRSLETTLAAPLASDADTGRIASVPAQGSEVPHFEIAPDEPKPGQEAAPAARQAAPFVVAAPDLSGQTLQREAPRDPLSRLSMALPPEPKPKNPWAGKPLFRPIATESAVFESGGNTISIEGVTSVGPDETCTYEGQSWACGVRARAAFRAWLRGRALVCQIPEGQDEAAMRGKCRRAKQDVGEWLVENGWAVAAPGGPYAQTGEAARAAGLGIFGAPPDVSSIGELPDLPASALPAVDLSIMTDEGGGAGQSADPRFAFPPAPPSP